MEASIKDEKSSESDAGSQEMSLLSISELDGPNKRGDESDSGDSEVETDAEAPATTVVSTKKRYPYAPLFFIMAATTGQRYT